MLQAMHDIRIPDPEGDKKKANKKSPLDVFEEHELDDDDSSDAVDLSRRAPAEPGEMIKVKFSKFVQLVATHDFEEVLKTYGDENVIVNTNLLTDLANAHEEVEPADRKIHMFFLIGIILGIVATYLVIKF